MAKRQPGFVLDGDLTVILILPKDFMQIFEHGYPGRIIWLGNMPYGLKTSTEE